MKECLPCRCATRGAGSLGKCLLTVAPSAPACHHPCSSLPPPPAHPCTGSTSTGYRVLATPCLTDAVPATSAALYAHPQLFRVNNDLYDGSYLNFMSTMQAPGLSTFTCLTTCT